MKFGIFNILKFLFVYVLLNTFCLICFSQTSCQTPDGNVGYCTPIKHCPSIVEILTTIERPLSRSAERQLQAYICNKTNDFKVCCPSSGNVIIREVKKNITAHRNYNLLPSQCGYIDDIGIVKIIHGMDADLTEFPWMALLSFRDPDDSANFRCGGTIINERYILTAAHCLEEKSRLIGVRLGEYDKSTDRDCFKKVCNDPYQDVAIEERIPHPHFQRSTYENDIGLLRVTPIRFNEKNIRPICLPQGGTELVNKEKVEITGWGLTSPFGRSSNVMQKANLPILKLEECQKLYKDFKEAIIDDRLICAGGGINKSFACVGDSGGPVQAQERYNNIIRYVQQGIVSLGPKTCNISSTFTRVDYYMNWILDNIKP